MSSALQAPSRAVHVVELGRLRDVVRRGAALLAETVVVPAVLLVLGLRLGGATAGLALVLAWRCGMPLARVLRRRRVPTAVWLTTSMFVVRVGSAAAIASVSFYLWQPIVISCALGVFFCVSGLIGHPVTLRLAGDLVRVPAEVVHDRAVRGIFSGMALIWGGVHVVCAGLGALVMRLPLEQAVVVQSGLGIVCTVGSTGGCLLWGVWRLHRLPHLSLRFAGAAEQPQRAADPALPIAGAPLALPAAA